MKAGFPLPAAEAKKVFEALRCPVPAAMREAYTLPEFEAALASLPADYREVLLLVGVEGFRPVDAAAVCGISPEALRQRLSRARALLTRRLEEPAGTRAPALREVTT
jgi:RNA polymerase sigma-70 factor (ECF subfamily)